MKANPTEIIESDGEEASLNKVDAALKSVGISLTDAQGQFRDLDEVIFELADKWDTLDRNTQRWIANTVAGSRQQSRFIAALSDSERLHELYNAALESEDASLIQYYKTMDSIETKMNQLSTSFQQFYMSVINGEVVKGIVSIGQSFVDTFNEIGPLFSTIVVANLLSSIKMLVLYVVASCVDAYKQIVSQWQSAENQMTNITRNAATQRQQINVNANAQAIQQSANAQQNGSFWQNFISGGKSSSANMVAMGLNIALNTLPTLVSSLAGADKHTTNMVKGFSQIANLGVGIFRVAVLHDYVGGMMQIVSSVISAVSAFTNLEYTVEELQQQEQKAKATAAESKKSYQDLTKLVHEYEESLGDVSKSQELRNKIVEQFPELEATFDAEGNAVDDLTSAYTELIEIKRQEAAEAQVDYLNAQAKTITARKKEYIQESNDKREQLEADIKQAEQVLYDISASRSRYISLDRNADYDPTADLDFVPNATLLQNIYKSIIKDDIETARATVTEWMDNVEAKHPGYSFLNRSQVVQNVIDEAYYRTELPKYQEELAALNKNQPKVEASYDKILAQSYRDNIETLEGYYEGTEQGIENITESIKDSSVLMKAGAALAAHNISTDLNGAELTLDDYVQNHEEWVESAYQSIVAWSKVSIPDIDMSVGDLLSDLPNVTYEQITKFRSWMTEALNKVLKNSDDYFKIESILNNFNQDANVINMEALVQKTVNSVDQLYAAAGVPINEILQSIHIIIPTLTSSELTALNDITGEITRVLEAEGTDAATKGVGINLLSELVRLIDNVPAERVGELLTQINDPTLWTTKLGTADLADIIRKFATTLDENTAKIFNDIADSIETDSKNLKFSEADKATITSDLKKAITNINTYFSKAISGTLSNTEVDKLIADGISADKFTFDVTTGGWRIPVDEIINHYMDNLQDKIDLLIAEGGDTTEIQQLQAELDYLKEHFYDSIKNDVGKALIDVAKSKDGITISDTIYQNLRVLDSEFADLFAFDFRTGQYKFRYAWEEFEDKVTLFLTNILDVPSVGEAKFISKEFYDNYVAKRGDIDVTKYWSYNEEFGGYDYVGSMEDYNEIWVKFFASIVPITEAELQQIINEIRDAHWSDDIKDAISAVGDDFTVSISEDVYNAFFQGKDGFIQTLNGYDFTQGPRAYLDLLKQVFDQMFNNGQITKLQYDYWQSESVKAYETAAKTEQKTALDNLSKQVRFTKRDVRDYNKIVESLRNGTADAETFGIAVNELGIAVNDFYKTADGKYGIIGSATKNLLSASRDLKKLESERYDIIKNLQKTLSGVNAQNKETVNLYRTQLNLIEQQIKAERERRMSVDKAGDREWNFGNPYEFYNNVASFMNNVKEGSVTLESLSNLIYNYGGYDDKDIQNLLRIMVPNATEDMSGIQLWDALQHSADISWEEGGEFKIPSEMMGDLIAAFSQLFENFRAYMAGEINVQQLAADALIDLEGKNWDLGEVTATVDTQVEQRKITYADAEGNPVSVNTFADLMNVISKRFNDESDSDFWVEFTAQTGLTLEQARTMDPEDFAEFILNALDIQEVQELLAREGITVAVPVNHQLVNGGSGGDSGDGTGGSSTTTNPPPDTGKEDQGENTIVITTKLDETSQTEVTQAIQHMISGASTPWEPVKITFETDSTTKDSVESDIKAIDDKNPIVTTSFEVNKLSVANVNTTIDAISAKKPIVTVLAQFKSGLVDTLTSSLKKILEQLPHTHYVDISFRPGGSGSSLPALARGTKSAKGGPALVGEEGPEIIVSDGGYGIAGASGVEIVNLRRGDIVFDADETKQILNDQTTSFAVVSRGNPGLAGAGSGGSASELPDWTGSGGHFPEFGSDSDDDDNDSKPSGGSGSGSSSDSGDKTDEQEYEMELDRWYNWLRQIEQAEYAINVEEAKRKNMTNGTEWAQSIYRENAMYMKQAEMYKMLAEEQEKYRDSLKTKYLEEYGKYFYFVGDALQLNMEAIEADTHNNQKLGEELQKLMDNYNEVNQGIKDNTVNFENNINKMNEGIKLLRDNYIKTENAVLDALKSMYQKEIDTRQDALDKRIESENKYLQALRDTLQKERDLRDKNNDTEEREQLQRKLALLERDTSGASDKEIAELRKKLREMQEEQYFNEREDAIDEIEESLTAQQEQAQAEIDILSEANELKLQNMQLYWEEVYNIMSQGSDNIIAFLQANSQEYIDASQTQREDWLADWRMTVESAMAYAQDMQQMFEQLYYDNYPVNPTYGNQNGTGSGAGSGTNGKPNGNTNTSGGGGSSGSGSSGGKYNGNTSSNTTQTTTPSKSKTGTLQLNYVCGTTKLASETKTCSPSTVSYGAFYKSFKGYNFVAASPQSVNIVAGQTSTITYNYTKATSNSSSSSNSSSTTTGSGGNSSALPNKKPNSNSNFYYYTAYARGGLVDYTGPAWVDGTKQKPESFLDAQDTQLLASFLESAKELSLGYSIPAVNVSVPDSSDGVTIENVAVTIESGVVDSRADAVDLGHGIADGLLEIARQSGNISVMRR